MPDPLDPPWSPGRYQSYDGITWEKLPDKPPEPSRFKRMIRYVTSPGRLIYGVVVAWTVAWLLDGHHITSGLFWDAYGCWFFAQIIWFWLNELHRWAGGKSKLSE